ncbi:MAG: class B sortase [Clostridia bacterium]|nr:class B sortase [Clostridia bacterium]
MNIEKNKKRKLKIYNCLIAIFGVVFIVSTFFLIKWFFLDPKHNEDIIDDIKKVYHDSSNENVNFNELRKINSDIIGWIRIENTPVDYPVLNSEDYLYKNSKKERSRYGSIFTDHTCIIEKDPQNIILHGHHMNNGSMFASICDFSNLTFYQANPVFTFDTIYERAKWKIISIFKTNTNPDHGKLFDYIISDFAGKKEDFLEYIYQVKVRSIINTPVDIADDDKILTLSTCSYEMKDFRTILVARKVRPNEDPGVDTASAVYNPKVLYPDAYYKRYGGSKPTVTSFKDALAAGEINWYKGEA